ncbi:MAG: hypothetical protein NUV98_05615 [Candidatus Roizmanbacteria bacterium]|nr:hypothetical protein [Candidatus Roizmanbacteria bacterium]
MKKTRKNKRRVIKPLWWVLGVLIVVAGIYALLQNNQNGYLPVQQIAPPNSKSSSTSTLIPYIGNGYKISYLSDWQLDESKQQVPAIMFVSSDDSARLFVQPQYDPRLTSGAETALIKNIYDAFKQNPDYSISATNEVKVNGNAAFLVEGTFQEQGKKLEFQEYTFFGESGDFYTVRINNEPGQYQKALDTMVGSFTITGPDANEVKARSLVENSSEVQGFKKQVEKSGRSTFGVRVDRTPNEDEPYYVIQVYELFPDHRTTFNWYRVHPTTWVVERQELATDTWEQVD